MYSKRALDHGSEDLEWPGTLADDGGPDFDDDFHGVRLNEHALMDWVLNRANERWSGCNTAFRFSAIGVSVVVDRQEPHLVVERCAVESEHSTSPLTEACLDMLDKSANAPDRLFQPNNPNEVRDFVERYFAGFLPGDDEPCLEIVPEPTVG